MAQRSLSRAASELFAYVQLFQVGPPSEKPAPGPLRAHFARALAGLAESPEARVLSATELDAARFALVTWIDEMVLRTSWPGRDAWTREPLQLELYRTNRGGDEFYERLAALGPADSQARGVFFLCLCFGFEGRLAGREAERQALVARQYELLRAVGAVADPAVLQPAVGPTAEELAIELPPESRHPLRGWLVAMGALLAGVFTVLWVMLFLGANRVPLPPGS